MLFLFVSPASGGGPAGSSWGVQRCRGARDSGTPKRLRQQGRPGCAKLIYLHIPKCGGTSVMSTLRSLRKQGVRVVDQDNYLGGSLEAEIAMEGLMPLKWPKKVLEIHVRSGAYQPVHAKVLALRAAYKKAGCRVSLGVLLREPQSLAKSWYSYCSRRHNQHGTKHGLPPFWALLRACGRRNVMANFLANGAFCERPGASDYPPRQPGPAAIAKLGSILRDFDLRDDVENMGGWLGRVFDLLQVDRRHCWIPRANDRSVRGLDEGKLLSDLPIPALTGSLCRCSPATLRLARTSLQNSTGEVSPDVLDWLTNQDKRLYQMALRR
eukprot:jgi/Tetstr1/434549/TSEL_023640.t1